MSRMQRCQPCDELQIKNTFSRRTFVRSGALVAAAFAASNELFPIAAGRPSAHEGSPIRLGLASYTFRNFSRAQMIGFLKQLSVLELNAKDVNDHLPADAQEVRVLQASRDCLHRRRRPRAGIPAAYLEVRERVRYPFRRPQSRAGR